MLKDISKRVSKYDTLECIAVDLGLEPYEIETAKTNNPHSIQGASFAVFQLWMNKGTTEPHTLAKALCDAGLSNCVDAFLMEEEESDVEEEDEEEFKEAMEHFAVDPINTDQSIGDDPDIQDGIELGSSANHLLGAYSGSIYYPRTNPFQNTANHNGDRGGSQGANIAATMGVAGVDYLDDEID